MNVVVYKAIDFFDANGAFCSLYAAGSSGLQDYGIVYCLQGNGIDRADTAGCNGKGWKDDGKSYTLDTIDRHAVVYDRQKTGVYGANGVASTLTRRDYKDATDIVVLNGAPRRYIARRLTPLECCRLQGYPDGWTEGMSIPKPSEEEISFWTAVWRDWAEINGKKPKSRSGVIKWLQNAGSDSAEYKAYGNSLAIPCANDVIRRIAEFAKKEATP